MKVNPTHSPETETALDGANPLKADDFPSPSQDQPPAPTENAIGGRSDAKTLKNSSTNALIGLEPDLPRLKSALLHTPPNLPLKEIAYHFVAPMTRAAREFPEYQEGLKALACTWACGELHDGKYPGLMAITRDGKTGKAYFAALWESLLTNTYQGKSRSLGSVYHVAKVAGWVYPQGGAKASM